MQCQETAVQVLSTYVEAGPEPLRGGWPDGCSPGAGRDIREVNETEELRRHVVHVWPEPAARMQ